MNAYCLEHANYASVKSEAEILAILAEACAPGDDCPTPALGHVLEPWDLCWGSGSFAGAGGPVLGYWALHRGSGPCTGAVGPVVGTCGCSCGGAVCKGMCWGPALAPGALCRGLTLRLLPASCAAGAPSAETVDMISETITNVMAHDGSSPTNVAAQQA
jgi:hypothetical protein